MTCVDVTAVIASRVYVFIFLYFLMSVNKEKQRELLTNQFYKD